MDRRARKQNLMLSAKIPNRGTWAVYTDRTQTKHYVYDIGDCAIDELDLHRYPGIPTFFTKGFAINAARNSGLTLHN